MNLHKLKKKNTKDKYSMVSPENSYSMWNKDAMLPVITSQIL